MPALAEAVDDDVDLLEVNHFYDDSGRQILTQLIGWEWRDDQAAFVVVFWRLVNDETHGAFPRRKRFAGRGYESLWRDGEVLRRVRAKAFRETWTQHDPELHNRELLPQEQRRGLTKPAN